MQEDEQRKGAGLTHRVRALITRDFLSLLLIKRSRQGSDPYWVFPGGGIEETDPDPESALRRELVEELGAEVDVLKLVFTLERQTAPGLMTKESFYLCRLLRYDETKRTGKEFLDLSRGTYSSEWILLDRESVAATNIRPNELKQFLFSHLTDLAMVEDLR
jgi:8-oxo-dGTP pyrophosphatase MutT (NUDIX family)